VLTAPGDILPNTSNVYSLGSASRQWADLWVSNSTIYMNSVPISLTAGNVLTVNGNAVLQNNSNTTISTTGNITAGNVNSPTLNNSGNISVVASGNTWTFGTDGATIFPTLTVTRGDTTGTLTGQTLLFGDSTQEAIISTPNGTNDINSSQRFVINPGAGADGTTGEGGDIYLYAGRGGDAGGSGGDIKIRGGLGPVNGAGGYITMEGGEADVNGVGGYIEIYGGQSGNSNGGYLDLRGGLGQTEGGAVFIQGGQGQAGPGGPVNITGGVSGNGLAEYGNVGVIAGVSGWVFNNTGNLVLPNGGVVYETNIPFGGLTGKTIALTPYGGTDADQQLLVYPTAGNVDANHLHLTTGNLYNTELFLGNDDFYVKLANTGNIVINSNNGVGNTAQWTFGTAGTILNSGNLTLQTPSGIPTSLSNWQGQGGWNQAFYSNVATTGGTGSGLTVDVAAAGAGYISINDITINTPGTGYTNGDVITINNENNLPGTFNVSVVVNDWTFDTTGVLTVPGNIVMPAGSSLVGNGASPAPNISGFNSATFGANVTATGNISGGNLITTGNLVFSSTQVQSSAYAGGNGHAMMIDTNRTDTYVEIGSADKPFKTFAAAIAAVATLNPTGTVPYTFILMGCNINETVDFTPYNFNFITISTTCRSVFNDPVIFGNSDLLQLTVRNVEFGDTVTITGDGTTNQLNNTSFYNTSFTGALTVTAANSLAFYEAAFFSTVTFNNVNYVYVNGGQFNSDWTIRADNSGAYPVPSNGITPGQIIALDFIANNIIFVKGGTGTYVFQPQGSRMGLSAGTYALPAGWTLSAYSSVFRGTWTNNGTWTMRNSSNDNAIAGTAPTYTGTIGGTTITATGNITGGNLTVGSGTITGGNVNGSVFNGNVAFGTGTVGGSGNITGGNISAIGNITGNTAGFAIGYRDIPQVSFTGNATIATTDAGKHFYSTQSSNFTLTIANNASQGFQVGAAITVVNQGTGTITIAQGSGVTMYLAGNATASNRSVATFGMATIMKVATDTWFINGTGVS
jgi:hypothetical protein